MKIIGIDGVDTQKQLKIKKILITTLICIIVLTIIIIICFYIGNKDFHEFVNKYVLMKNAVENNVASISLEGLENYNAYAYDRYISVLNQNTLIRL